MMDVSTVVGEAGSIFSPLPSLQFRRSCLPVPHVVTGRLVQKVARP